MIVISKYNTYHPKYGFLKEGEKYEIEDKDFGNEIFEEVKINGKNKIEEEKEK